MSGISADTALEYLPLAVLVADSENRVMLLNPAAEEWLGTSARFAVGRPLMEFVGEDERFFALLSRVRAERATLSEYDYPLAMRGGRHDLVSAHATPLGAAGQVMLAVTRKHYAPARQSADARDEAARTSGLMAAMLAHEVKNPLSGIRGAAQLLQQDARAEQQPMLALICNEVDRIKHVLSRVEPFSDAAPDLAPLNAHEALRYLRQVAEAGFAAGVTFREEFDPSLPEVLASPHSFAQILLNLLKNAGEALEGHAAPRITLMSTSRQDYGIMGTRGIIRPQAHVLVEDNGPGIAAGLRTRLFEPFTTTHADKGRGLGLAIAAKLAADMGGQLALESAEPGCTRFRLTLRAAG